MAKPIYLRLTPEERAQVEAVAGPGKMSAWCRTVIQTVLVLETLKPAPAPKPDTCCWCGKTRDTHDPETNLCGVPGVSSQFWCSRQDLLASARLLCTKPGHTQRGCSTCADEELAAIRIRLKLTQAVAKTCAEKSDRLTAELARVAKKR